jgi:hypothetical protein
MAEELDEEFHLCDGCGRWLENGHMCPGPANCLYPSPQRAERRPAPRALLKDVRLPNLTRLTPDAPQLVSDLEGAHLPAQAWKRLYLVALQRMGKYRPQLAQLCGAEALYTVYSVREPGNEDFLESKLRAIEEREVNARTLARGTGLGDPLHLFHVFRETRRLLTRKPSPDEVRDLLSRWGSSRPDAWVEEALSLAPIPGALFLAAMAFGYKNADSVRAVICGQGGFRLTE